jgi:hypothetical protein
MAGTYIYSLGFSSLLQPEGLKVPWLSNSYENTITNATNFPENKDKEI